MGKWIRGTTVVQVTALLILFGCSSSSQQTEQKSAPATESRETPRADLPPPGGNPIIGSKPQMPDQINRPEVREVRVENFATGLEIPWDMVFLPNGRVLVTERPGRVRLIENGRLRPQPYATVQAAARGEGGLMGIAVHPSYPNPSHIYLMYTYHGDSETFNRISRFTDTQSGLSEEKVLLDRIPAARSHDGGALEFGPDGMLYAGTGDAGRPESAQDMDSLAGKILRMNPDGSIPADNPFANSPIYALGLRNVQGLAWEPGTNRLWATMHGPSGEFNMRAMDGVFRLEPGANAGWPRVLGVSNRRGVANPVLFYTGSSVPPAGAIFYTGSLFPEYKGNFFFATLASEHLQRVVPGPGNRIERIERWWQIRNHEGKYGRLRGVSQGPDGAIYVTTSNRDGRGKVRRGDDRILRITPAARQ